MSLHYKVCLSPIKLYMLCQKNNIKFSFVSHALIQGLWHTEAPKILLNKIYLPFQIMGRLQSISFSFTSTSLVHQHLGISCLDDKKIFKKASRGW